MRGDTCPAGSRQSSITRTRCMVLDDKRCAPGSFHRFHPRFVLLPGQLPRPSPGIRAFARLLRARGRQRVDTGELYSHGTPIPEPLAGAPSATMPGMPQTYC